MKQQKLFDMKNSKSHGGNINLGKRKLIRPLDKNRLHHIVMKSQRAKGLYSFKDPSHRQQVEDLIYNKAQQYGVCIIELANVGTHFHLLVRFQNRQLLKIFFKVTMGLIARIVTKAQKGKSFGRFWDQTVFTRVVSKGIDEAQIFDYLLANQIESEEGKLARESFLNKKRKLWQSRRQRNSNNFDNLQQEFEFQI